MQRIKLEGKKFGYWTVGKYLYNKQNHSFYQCTCVCGTKRAVSGNYLRRGTSTNCSCIQYQAIRDRGEARKKERPHWKRLRNVHHGMSLRCSIKGKGINENYYHRGIRVDAEWKTFPPFYKWAVSNGYKPGLEIDRIDNNGNYKPTNCRWVTRSENCKNRRPKRWVKKPKYASILQNEISLPEDLENATVTP